jgi:hypothetical protein
MLLGNVGTEAGGITELACFTTQMYRHLQQGKKTQRFKGAWTARLSDEKPVIHLR